jgi:hypothetical protein
VETTHGDSWLAGVILAGHLVELPDGLGAVERVRLGARRLVGGGGEHPPHVVVGLLGPLKDGLHRLRLFQDRKLKLIGLAVHARGVRSEGVRVCDGLPRSRWPCRGP